MEEIIQLHGPVLQPRKKGRRGRKSFNLYFSVVQVVA
jgi:hypothetical protein